MRVDRGQNFHVVRGLGLLQPALNCLLISEQLLH
jgi:hypothetical protein